MHIHDIFLPFHIFMSNKVQCFRRGKFLSLQINTFHWRSIESFEQCISILQLKFISFFCSSKTLPRCAKSHSAPRWKMGSKPDFRVFSFDNHLVPRSNTPRASKQFPLLKKGSTDRVFLSSRFCRGR